jgi:hypothetical protein
MEGTTWDLHRPRPTWVSLGRAIRDLKLRTLFSGQSVCLLPPDITCPHLISHIRCRPSCTPRCPTHTPSPCRPVIPSRLSLTPHRILGIDYSSNAACTRAKVGYTLDPTFFGQDTGLESAVVKSLAGALVLNPIAAGFAGVSLSLALAAWCCANTFGRIMEIVSGFLGPYGTAGDERSG